MNSPENDLANALRERRRIIGDDTSRRDPERHLAQLQAISEEIDSCARALPPPVDARLAHYLARCSYDKALEVLEG